MLNQAQTAAKTFLTTDAHSYVAFGDTQTVSGWYGLGSDGIVVALMNDQAFGAGIGKRVARSTIPGGDIIAAVGASADFAVMDPSTLNKLQWLVQKDPVSIGDAKTAAAIDNALTPYALAKVDFGALKQRGSSVWESITGVDGSSFSASDLSAIRNS